MRIISGISNKIFQKSANLPKSMRNETLIKSGILNPDEFDKYITVTAYKPHPDLAPFISHYWMIRWQVPEGLVCHPVELLSQPVVNLFFSSTEAYIYGLINTTFEYEAKGTGTLAGVTFMPGGFYSWWGKPVADLPKGRVPLNSMMSGVDSAYCARLLEQNDAAIVKRLDELLLKSPHAIRSAHLPIIADIVKMVSDEPVPPSITTIAKRVRMSERTIQHIFKNEVGTTLQWHIKRTRLLAAAAQAQKEPKPHWAQIAADLGYSSQAHFATDFKRAIGQSPGKFKKF